MYVYGIIGPKLFEENHTISEHSVSLFGWAFLFIIPLILSWNYTQTCYWLIFWIVRMNNHICIPTMDPFQHVILKSLASHKVGSKVMYKTTKKKW